jgi:hypothetical protein
MPDGIVMEEEQNATERARFNAWVGREFPSATQAEIAYMWLGFWARATQFPIPQPRD